MLFLKFTITAILVSILLISCAYAEQSPQQISADIKFHCLWWSETQMEGFDPNSPPPKTSEVIITKWEYTDPVGVPHPDSVDAVVTLTNEGSVPLTDLLVTIAGQWKTGPLRSRAKAAWSGMKPIETWQSITVAPGKSTVLRVPIDIAGRISELEKKRSWPWMFRALLTVRVAGVDKPLLKRKMGLPIIPGD